MRIGKSLFHLRKQPVNYVCGSCSKHVCDNFSFSKIWSALLSTLCPLFTERKIGVTWSSWRRCFKQLFNSESSLKLQSVSVTYSFIDLKLTIKTKCTLVQLTIQCTVSSKYRFLDLPGQSGFYICPRGNFLRPICKIFVLDRSCSQACFCMLGISCRWINKKIVNKA